MKRLLIANRGEVAVRVARAAAVLGIPAVAVHSADDDGAPHTRRVADTVALQGEGPRAYLDVDAVVAAAVATRCDALHPGWGLLSESAALARACWAAGVTFVGPSPDVLDLLGDKVAARGVANELGVPTLPGRPVQTLDDALSAFDELAGASGVMLKAVAGGGGRGMRAVADREALGVAWERCRGEAQSAFGDGSLFVERLVGSGRHIEIQVVADNHGALMTLGERECTLQRRHQKVIEFTPSPSLTPSIRSALCDASLTIARHVGYAGLATFEFLVEPDGSWWFIEANPRLQVEHTITEAVYGIDLVAAQLRLADGETLDEVFPDVSARGRAIQLRINAEVLEADGTVRPSGGVIRVLTPPGGPGVRFDSGMGVGSEPNPRFDTLLGKLIVRISSGDHVALLAAAGRALDELEIDGPATNVDIVATVLSHPDVTADQITTSWFDEHTASLLAGANDRVAFRAASLDHLTGTPAPAPTHRAATSAASRPTDPTAVTVQAPMPATVVSIAVQIGDVVAAGAELAVLEAMKMEHVIVAPTAGLVLGVPVAAGRTIAEGDDLIVLTPSETVAVAAAEVATIDVAAIRPDLAEVLERQGLTRDEARHEAVAKRRTSGRRTARENVADLIDAGSFVEYGSLVIAAQRRRRPLDDLIHRTQADGLVAGLATVNAALVGTEQARCMVLSYDYMVLAGTQGLQNHRKKDRMFELAERMRTPVVFFTEGGGGRPGDTDGMGVAGLDCRAFGYFAELSGLVPLIGINAGRCFAGNAAILGCCDVVIATRDSSIGMGGPAMIEGGGLGVFHPDEVGPVSVQEPNGVIDVLVDDEAEAVAVAKRYLSYFQGSLDTWDCADQRRLRHMIPENRLRVYDIRQVVETLGDTGSVLELRRGFGLGMVTALARVEGRPVGIVANNPAHLAGAIDSDAADKAARFLQLCDAFDLPVVFLCDTPGMMVGPDVEQTALVRHCSRLFVTGASLTVPFVTVVLRKGYGLGAQAMAGGSFHAPLLTVGWPTSEFGGMGLEGAVRLGYRNELAAIDDPQERAETYVAMVERMYQIGKGVNMASHFEIDDVIDPADTRRVVVGALRSAAPPPPRLGKKRPMIDTW